MNTKILAFTLLMSLCLSLTAQPYKADSFFEKLKSAQHDTDKATIYLSISRFYWNRNTDSSLLMAHKALDMAKGANYNKGMASALMMMGIISENKGNYPEALKYDLQALRINEQTGLGHLVRKTLNNIGMVYTDIGDYPKALDYFNRSLDAALRDPGDTAHLSIGVFLLNLAETYNKMDEFDSAIVYNRRGLQVAEKNNDSNSITLSLMNIAENYLKMRKFEQAVSHAQAALKMAEAIQDEEAIVWSNLYLSEARYPQKRYQQSIDYATSALSRAEKMQMNESIKDASHTLYLNYEALGKFKQALYYLKRETNLKDSLFGLDKVKKIKVLQSDYELERQQYQIDLLNKDKLIRENEVAKESILRYFFITIAGLMGLGCLFLFRSNARNRRLNRLLKSRNEEIIRQNLEQEDLNRVKNKLLSIIGHDLRGPISALKGFVYLLQESILSEEQIRYFIAKMNESLMTTSHLLDNLLFWAKSQMGGIYISPRQFDVEEVLLQNSKLWQGRAEQKKIALVCDLGNGPMPVYADETMIDLVIRNLVENSIKFCKEGDRITIITASHPQYTRVIIHDNGPGIPKEQQVNILNGSISYTTSGTSKETGSGLGLSLCKELVEKNGGKMGFESEPGHGTSFFFTIPHAAVF